MRIELVWVDKSGMPVDGKSQSVEVSTVPGKGEMIAIEESGRRGKPWASISMCPTLFKASSFRSVSCTTLRRPAIHIREATEP